MVPGVGEYRNDPLQEKKKWNGPETVFTSVVYSKHENGAQVFLTSVVYCAADV